MRQRINLNAICSSSNYERSRELHREYVRKCHANNIAQIAEISASIIVKKRYFVKCFGKLVEVSAEDALQVKGIMIVVEQ